MLPISSGSSSSRRYLFGPASSTCIGIYILTLVVRRVGAVNCMAPLADLYQLCMADWFGVLAQPCSHRSHRNTGRFFDRVAVNTCADGWKADAVNIALGRQLQCGR